MKRLLIGLAVAVATSVPGICSAADASEVRPLGRFEDVRSSDGDHTSGRRADLWHAGRTLLGTFAVWEWIPEGTYGDFVDGEYDPSGRIRFTVTIRNEGIRPRIERHALFVGRLKGNVLSGQMRWLDNPATSPIEGGKVKLRRSNVEMLKPFSDVMTWEQSAPSDRYGPGRAP